MGGPHGQDISDEELERKWNAITEQIKMRTPLCPLNDGTKGSFVRLLGWRGDALYRCPKGDEFAARGDLVKILKPKV